MKFTQELSTANVVHSWEPGLIRVRERVLKGHVILTADRIIEPWVVRNAARLCPQDFLPVLDLSPAVIILGTGARLTFPDTSLVGELASKGVGLEVMDTAAACRTFNVLVHEDRAVAAALLNDPAAP